MFQKHMGNYSSGWSGSFSDVVRLSGRSVAEVTNWARKGLLPADIRRTRGRGNHRIFGFRNIVEATICGYLNEAGMSVEAMRPGLSHLRFLDEAADAAIKSDEKKLQTLLTRWLKSGHSWQPTPEILREEVFRWRAAKTPELRDKFEVIALAYSLTLENSTFMWLLATGEQVDWAHISPAFVVVNIGNILTSLEKRLGSSWGGELEAAEFEGGFAGT